MNRGTIRRVVIGRLAPLGVVLVLALVSAARCGGQSSTPAEERLHRQLDAPVSVAWRGQALAEGLARLGEAQELPLWIDRRVDPATAVDVQVDDRPLREALAAIAGPHDLHAAPYHGVLYVGPRQAAEEVATLGELARQSLARAPAAARSRWLKSEPWSFPKLSEPRALLKKLAASAQTALAADGAVPHDLWPARSLPALPAIDRAVLLLVGFDLTCELSPDGRTLRIAPIERPVLAERRYRIARAQQESFDALLADMGVRPVERAGKGALTVRATAEQHRRLQESLHPPRRRDPAGPSTAPADDLAAKRFTLKIENQPAGSVVDQLARQLKLDVQWDGDAAQAAAARATPVACDVRQVDLDGLLHAVLTPRGLQYERDVRKLVIRRAP